MGGVILLGYDVETASESTRGFLRGARRMHAEMGIPYTVFFTGKTIEQRADDCLEAAADSLCSLGQHTYNHILLKTVNMRPGDGKPVKDGKLTYIKEGGSLDQIEDEVGRAQDVFQRAFGRECRGLTAPWCYYRGLQDRPDVLKILYRHGIHWVRSYGRDARDCQPTPHETQPFFYSEQGFPQLLECPIQGYQDDFYWDRFDDRAHGPAYADYLLWAVQYVAERNFVWCVLAHDHETPTMRDFEARKGVWLRALLRRAQALGIRFMRHEQFYAEMALRYGMIQSAGGVGK